MDFEETITGVECITQHWRKPGRSLVTQHAYSMVGRQAGRLPLVQAAFKQTALCRSRTERIWTSSTWCIQTQTPAESQIVNSLRIGTSAIYRPSWVWIDPTLDVKAALFFDER